MTIQSKAATQEYRDNYDAIFNKSDKPVEYYSDTNHIEVGYRASVKVPKHRYHTIPSNCWVNTSPVLSYDKETGVFETLNTIYKPVDTEEQ